MRSTAIVWHRITLDQAVELGLINAREFQDRREDLYLAALPVTLERFNFATQAFWIEQVARRSIGAQLPGSGEFWTVGTNASLAKRFPTGALLLFELANQVVIDLGRQPNVSVSTWSLTAISRSCVQGSRWRLRSERNMVCRDAVTPFRKDLQWRRAGHQ